MNKTQLSTTIKRASRHLWKHDCGETYTRKDITIQKLNVRFWECEHYWILTKLIS